MSSERDLLSRPAWFVLNHIGGAYNNSARQAVDRYNSAYGKRIELFAPTYVIREDRNGEIKFRTASLTFHYVFVRGTLTDVKQLCALSSNNFSFVLDLSSKNRYAVIDDMRMIQFMNLAKVYKNCLPCFPVEDIDLEDGDRVEVMNGMFQGITGRYMAKPKSNTGNIVLCVCDKLMTIAYDVKAIDVRVLEFSDRFTRANDQIDAIVPHVFKALRYYHRSEVLSTSLVAKLSVFSARMDVVHLNNRKLDAKLQAILYCANTIIGNIGSAAMHRARYEKIKDSITNVWTGGLITLMLSVIENDLSLMNHEYEKLLSRGATSRTHNMIMGEYGYYLSLTDKV